MEEEKYTNSELTILRRLSEFEKENFRKRYDYWFADPRAKKEGNLGLWYKFMNDFGITSRNGGPSDYWEFCEKTLFPGAWVDSKERVTWSMYDRDEVLDKLLMDLNLLELLG